MVLKELKALQDQREQLVPMGILVPLDLWGQLALLDQLVLQELPVLQGPQDQQVRLDLLDLQAQRV